MAARRALPPTFAVCTASLDGRAVTSGMGQALTVDRSLAGLQPDVIVVPGFLATTADEVAERLARPDIAELSGSLRALHDAGATLVAGCTGTFVLAEAGLLDGHPATTTWWLADLFRQRYPDVMLDVDRMVTRSDQLMCSGAAMAHMDLALALIDDLAGPGVADAVGRLLLLEGRPSQAKYMASSQLSARSPEILAAERYIRANLSQRFGVDDMARHIGVGRRTLARRFREASGMSPLAFVQRIRVEHAVHLLETTAMSVEAIADAVGYDGVTAFRRVFRRETGRAPSAYRTPVVSR